MKNLGIARRYAKALLLIGQQDGQTERYRNELQAMAGLVAQDRRLDQAINNPLYESTARKRVLQSLIATLKFSKAMESFLILLFEKGRFGFLGHINDFYQKLADELKGVARATVTSASALSADAVDRIRAALSKRTGKGSALAGALKYCRKLSGDRLAVVIFPGSGSPYLSKFYDDKWMREFGFLSTEFGETALGDLLHAKPNKTLHVARLGDTIRKVVTVMHQHGISQMPVVGAGGELVGLLEEVDLLNHMLEKHEHSHEEIIDDLVQNAGAVFPQETPLKRPCPP